MQFQKQRAKGDGGTMTLLDETAGDTSDVEEAKILQNEILTCIGVSWRKVLTSIVEFWGLGWRLSLSVLIERRIVRIESQR